MQKLPIYTLATLLLLTSGFSTANATSSADRVPNSAATSGESPALNALIARLHELEKVDKSKLNSVERKALRKEVRATKENVREVGGGIYISVGALIIIILLVIILL